MSWNIKFIGKSENVIKALEDQSNQFTGDSKKEYDAAKPHLIELVKQNFNDAADVIVEVEASGHGWDGTGDGGYRTLTAKVGQLYGILV